MSFKTYCRRCKETTPHEHVPNCSSDSAQGALQCDGCGNIYGVSGAKDNFAHEDVQKLIQMRKIQGFTIDGMVKLTE